jgi:uncharacterized membrane protein
VSKDPLPPELSRTDPHSHVHEHEMLDHERVDHEAHAALKVRLARLELLLGLGHTEAGRFTHHLPAWLRPTRGEHRLAVTVALAIVIALQLRMRADLALPPKLLWPLLEVLLYALLIFLNPRRISRETPLARTAGLLLVLIASLATLWSVARLVYQLATGHAFTAVELLVNGGSIWLINVIVFALWYWEFDRGGPAARANARLTRPDFLFTQMTAPELVSRDWEPGFVDYLYLSFTNATAFSPTDTLPLSRWAKLAMMFQSAVSLATLALVVARAVNILS